MTYIRYTPGLEPGGDKQVGVRNARLQVIDDTGHITDISQLVLEARTKIKPGHVAILSLDIAGFELA